MFMGITIIGLSLLICMELVSSSKANNCTSFQAFGKRIGDAINSDLMQKINCTSVTCSKIRCSGIPLYIPSSLKQKVTFSADIDYCSPKPRIQLKVYASFFNVTVNKILLNNTKNVLLLYPNKKFHILISPIFIKTKGELNITIVVKFNIPVTGSSTKLEMAKYFGGFISSSHCPHNTSNTTLTTKTIPKVTNTKNSSIPITSLKTSSMTNTAMMTLKTNTTASKTSKPTTKTVTASKTTNTQKTSKLTSSILEPTTIAIKPTLLHSKTNKTILLVLAIIILIVVIAMVIYCRKKKRLSNLPAYYNDIVINDPLKLETENDFENANDADDINDNDELPLFS